MRSPKIFCLAFVCGVALAGFAYAKPRVFPGAKSPPPNFDSGTTRIFFNDARDHLQGTPKAQGGVVAPRPQQAPVTAEAPADTENAIAWKELISATSLEDEIKSQLSVIEEAVRSPSTFKGGGYKTTRSAYTYLAVLFAVVDQYDGPVRWKDDAAALSATFARAGRNSKVGTDASFKESQMRSEDLREIIRGGRAELLAATPDAAWAEIADRPPLMTQMDHSVVEQLKPWTGRASEFANHKDAIVRESQALALLARVIQDESYEYGDDETYLEYARALEQHALALRAAAENDSLDRAQSAVAQIMQSCTTCHEGYRSGG